MGMGFTFDDSGPADDHTPGIPSPIGTMEKLIAENSKNADVIYPYIGGEEVNSSPIHAHHRFVINFGERGEGECRREWPDLMAIVERKVKPERVTKPGSYSKQWWLFGRRNQAGTVALAHCTQAMVIALTSNTVALAKTGAPRSLFSLTGCFCEGRQLSVWCSAVLSASLLGPANRFIDERRPPIYPLRLLRNLPLPLRPARFRRQRSSPRRHPPEPRSHRRAVSVQGAGRLTSNSSPAEPLTAA